MATVLVVDDDKETRRLVRMQLEDKGHEVSVGDDGEQATRALKEKSYDLLITDLIMPNKEGIELIMECRKAYPKMKIIAISGVYMGVGGTALPVAEKLGADAALEKPFKFAKLLETVNAVLAKE